MQMPSKILGVIVSIVCSTACGSQTETAVENVPTALPSALRVCADPNNLPFSNDRREGFENEIAALLASDLDVPLEYTWFAQRRGFLRATLNARQCDVVIGLPTSMEAALTTRPYYRSSYVFVTSAKARSHPRSFDDAILRTMRIGVPLVGDDGANAPPAHALSRRGIVTNVAGYSVYGDYRSESPPSALIEAVASGDIDVAVAWGPTAGYFAARHRTPLQVTPVEPQIDQPFLPFVFDVSMAVRRDAPALHARLEDFLERRRSEVDAILARFHVPRVDSPVTDAADDSPLSVAVIDTTDGGTASGFAVGSDEVTRAASLLRKEWTLTAAPVAAVVISAKELAADAPANVYSVRASPAARNRAVAMWRREHPGADVSAVEWHASLSRFGAEQLNARLERVDPSPDSDVWAGWMAAKVAAEIVFRDATEPAALSFDGHKGTPLRFSADRYLQQPLIMVAPDGKVVGTVDPSDMDL
jgi:mxaJ protein